MIETSVRPVGHPWRDISFSSTLYLRPIIDLLLVEIPLSFRAEVRLGLQEALVNAAKHGNNLDPSKVVFVRFCMIRQQYWWIISDQGSGFTPPCRGSTAVPQPLPHEDHGCGRGLYILYQIFDRVHWNPQGTRLSLGKHVNRRSKLPLLT
ncbi:MAG TPA: anti-sigma regulatory factor [Candidatus Caenarcaniphilales bacterium]